MFRLDTQTLFAFVVLIVGIVLLCSRITTIDSCPNTGLTPTSCQTGGPPLINNSQVVQYTLCKSIPTEWLLLRSKVQYGLMTNYPPSDNCQQYGCQGCLKNVQRCFGTGTSATTCVKSTTTQDIQPMALIIYLFIFIIPAIILIFLPFNLVSTPARVVAGAVFFIGWWFLEDSIIIVNGCPYSQQTYSGCGSGTNGEVANSEIVQFTVCSPTLTSDKNSPPISPFSSNSYVDPNCLSIGCNQYQCIKTTTPCKGANMNPQSKCVAQQSISIVAPVDMFFALLIIFAGAGAFFLAMWKEDELKPMPRGEKEDQRKPMPRDEKAEDTSNQEMTQKDEKRTSNML